MRRARPATRLPYFVVLLPLTLAVLASGCGEPAPLSDRDVERIASRAAALMRPVVEEAVERAVQKAAKVPATPGAPPPGLPPAVATPVPPPPPTAPDRLLPPIVPPPATTPPPASPAGASGDDRLATVIAKIGDIDQITLGDYLRLRTQNQRIGQVPIRQGLQELMQFRIMAAAARLSGLPKSDPRLLSTLMDRLAEFRYEYMVQDGLAALPALSDEEVRAAYDRDLERYTTPGRMEVWEIVVGSQAEAQALLATVDANSFETEAKSRSLALTRDRGGRLGTITKERLPKEAWDALAAAADGAQLGPFAQTGGQWAIYRRGSYTAPTASPFESVSAAIRATLEGQRREQVAAALVEKARRIWKVEGPLADPAKANEPGTVLVKIGPQAITQAELDLAQENLDPRRARMYAGEEGKKALLDALSQRILVSNLALTDPGFLARREPFLADVERQLLINHYVANTVYQGIEPSEAELKAFYEANREERFKTPPDRSLRARHLLASCKESDPEALVAEKKAKVEAALARISAGEPFATVARELSEGPTAPNGGDLGVFGPGRMVEPFDKAVQALAAWQVTTQPVRTRFGWHLILREPVETHLSFDQVRDQLAVEVRRDLERKKVADHLDLLWKQHPAGIAEGLLPSEDEIAKLAAVIEPPVRPQPPPAAPPQTVSGAVVGKSGEVQKTMKFRLGPDGKLVPEP